MLQCEVRKYCPMQNEMNEETGEKWFTQKCTLILVWIGTEVLCILI